jgi:hypothetical protein
MDGFSPLGFGKNKKKDLGLLIVRGLWTSFPHLPVPQTAPSTEHVGNLERFGLLADNIDRRRHPLFSRDRERGGTEGDVLTSGVIHGDN